MNMTKEHYISFISYVTNDRCEIVKLYPEQNANKWNICEFKLSYAPIDILCKIWYNDNKQLM